MDNISPCPDDFKKKNYELDEKNCLSANNNKIHTINTRFKINDSYERTDESKCYEILDPGAYIFDTDGNKVEFDKKTNSDLLAKYYSMYVCSDSQCVQTIGYIKIDELFTYIDKTDSNYNEIVKDCEEKIPDNIYKYWYKYGKIFQQAVTKDLCSQALYRKIGPKYYFISSTNTENLAINNNDNGNCGVGQEGILFSKNEGSLCLGVGNTGKNPVEIEFNNGNNTEYYLTKSTSGSGFSVKSGKAIILKGTENIIYQDNLINYGKKIFIILLLLLFFFFV